MLQGKIRNHDKKMLLVQGVTWREAPGHGELVFQTVGK